MTLRKKNYYICLIMLILQSGIALAMSNICFLELRTNAHQGNMISLARCQEIIDRSSLEAMESAERLMKVISTSALPNSSSPYKTPSNVMSIRNTRETVMSSIPNSSMVNDLFVFLDKPEIVISPSLAYLSYEKFYQDYFSFGSYDYARFRDEVLYSESSKSVYPDIAIRRFNKVDEYIVFSLRYPLDQSVKKSGRVLALLSKNEIASLVKGSYLESHGGFFITDYNGDVLLTINNGLDEALLRMIDVRESAGGIFFHADGEDYMASYIISPSTGWKYVGIMNQQNVMTKVRGLQSFLHITIFISLGVSLCIVGILLFCFNKSLRSLIGAIASNLGLHDDFTGKSASEEQVHHSLRLLIKDREQLRSRLESHLPIMANTFVHRLLKRDFQDEGEIRLVANQLNIEMNQARNVVAGVHLRMTLATTQTDYPKDRLTLLESIKLIVRELVSSKFDQVLAYNAASDHMFLIIGCEEQSEEDMRSDLTGFLQESTLIIAKQYPCEVSFTLGRFFQNILDSALSYQDVCNVISYHMMEDTPSVMWYDDITTISRGYYYPLDIEMQLISRLTQNGREAVGAILAKIREENCDKRNLAIATERWLIMEMIGTLQKAIANMTINGIQYPKTLETDIAVLEQHGDLNAFFSQYGAICNAVCDINTKMLAKNRMSYIVGEITAYIDEHYPNPDLSLEMLADHFGFAASYLSRVYKEHTGESFSTRLRAIRIQSACKLLHTCDNIDKISKQVGYYNSNSFRVSFKGMTGIAPSQYRHSIKHQGT